MSNFPLRLSEGIQADMERLAKEHSRSLNNEIVEACKAWLEEYVQCCMCHEKGVLLCRVCEPPSWYCVYHYEQKHLPEDERDEEV